MNYLLVSALVVVGALLTIAVLSAGSPVDLDQLLSRLPSTTGSAPTPSPGPAAPAAITVTPTPPHTPSPAPESGPTMSPPGPTIGANIPVPTSTLTPREIFALLDAGKITAEEAAALLSKITPTPTATPTPIPGLVPTISVRPTPEVSPTAPPTPDAPQRGSQMWIGRLEIGIHALVNVERRRNSVEELAFDHELASVARGHSKDMADHDYFSHDNLSGQSPTDRGNEAGYHCLKNYGAYYTEGIAENIFQTYLYSAAFYQDGVPVRKTYMSIDEIAHQVVTGWMGSPGHRENMLEDSYDRQGIGVAISADEKVYVTQNFC